METHNILKQFPTADHSNQTGSLFCYIIIAPIPISGNKQKKVPGSFFPSLRCILKIRSLKWDQ